MNCLKNFSDNDNENASDRGDDDNEDDGDDNNDNKNTISFSNMFIFPDFFKCVFHHLNNFRRSKSTKQCKTEQQIDKSLLLKFNKLNTFSSSVDFDDSKKRTRQQR